MTSNETEIEALAYSLWESRGRPDGSSDEDWLAAEKALKDRGVAPAPSATTVDDASKDSFPASDAPGSHLPDKPPSNAGAKWAASAAAKANGTAGGQKR